MGVVWPDNKRFGFTIIDDTDGATVAGVGEIYLFLRDLGITTTKSVWMFRGGEPFRQPGETCEDPHYLKWVLDLQQHGVEIGYHLATWSDSPRERSLAALDKFAELFGHPPITATNHSDCRENIYWGAARLGGVWRLGYNLATGFRFANRYRGHVEGDPYFWGDLCQERVRYVRNFVYSDMNTLKVCPMMPYHDPLRPFVRYWFASSEGSTVNLYNQCVTEQNQDRLEEEGGACIMYTHLAAGFFENGKINARFRTLMERLAKKPGWFVPAATLLGHLHAQRGGRVITDTERSALERRWLWEKLRYGRS